MILMHHNKEKNDDCQVFYCFLLFVIVFHGYPAASTPGGYPGMECQKKAAISGEAVQDGDKRLRLNSGGGVHPSGFYGAVGGKRRRKEIKG